jgi:hypothetical protein
MGRWTNHIFRVARPSELILREQTAFNGIKWRFGFMDIEVLYPLAKQSALTLARNTATSKESSNG